MTSDFVNMCIFQHTMLPCLTRQLPWNTDLYLVTLLWQFCWFCMTITAWAVDIFSLIYLKRYFKWSELSICLWINNPEGSVHALTMALKLDCCSRKWSHSISAPSNCSLQYHLSYWYFLTWPGFVHGQLFFFSIWNWKNIKLIFLC